MASFRIGGKVIAVKVHSQNLFKKGDIFKIWGLKESCCNKGQLVLDIGFAAPFGGMCPVCGYMDNSKIGWFHSKLFVPLDDMQTELSEVTEASVDEIINEPQTI